MRYPQFGLHLAKSAVLLAAALIGACRKTDAPKLPPTIEEIQPDFRITARDLIAERRHDPQAWDRKYRGKVIEITGWVFRMETADKPGGGHAAVSVTLTSRAFKEAIIGVLDRSLTDSRWILLDYFTRIKLRGRCDAGDGNSIRLVGCVTNTAPLPVLEMPVALTVDAVTLEKAMRANNDDPSEFENYADRVITVKGELASLTNSEHGSGYDATLKTDLADRPIWFYVSNDAAKRLQEKGIGARVSVTGLCYMDQSASFIPRIYLDDAAVDRK